MNKRFDFDRLPGRLKRWDFLEIIEKYSTLYNLNPYHILALVFTESKGITTATKYEPSFKWISKDEIPSMAERMGVYPETCKMLLKTSFGLGQVMGQVFIENGGLDNPVIDYRNPVIMCDKRFGLYHACKAFSQKMKNYGPSIEYAYASYNSGSPRINHETKKFINQENVDNYMKNLEWITSEVRF